MSFPIAAFAGGGLILIIVIIMIVLAVAYGFYTFKGVRSTLTPATGWTAHPAPPDPASHRATVAPAKTTMTSSAPAEASRLTEPVETRSRCLDDESRGSAA